MYFRKKISLSKMSNYLKQRPQGAREAVATSIIILLLQIFCSKKYWGPEEYRFPPVSSPEH